MEFCANILEMSKQELDDLETCVLCFVGNSRNFVLNFCEFWKLEDNFFEWQF